MTKVQSPAGTQLNSRQETNVHALSVSCPVCGAESGKRCTGAVSYPDGYTDQLHVPRERELERSLSEATAGLTKGQGARVRALFVTPSTVEERRAVAHVLLRP